MPSRPAPRRALPIALALTLIAAPAWAACTDPAGPAVNWRRCYHDGRDLKGVDMSGAMLREATFQRSDLSGATLQKVDGYRAKFFSAKLLGTVLDESRLIEADFTRADLSGAKLRGADLRNAKMVDTILKQADLTGARLDGTDLRNADLSGATWTDGKRTCATPSVGQCN
ncbi:pentapeptide repeat-containing protein [Aerophototrophica crusticola]|uniref:Pentapeptide repeat-containing protein n=1 Tax=Aerophototrophica crusticola TaxID=1709002 RepID=A0A858R4J8_9PROT|nr:pentapeptide repeat-containing protein [Rhodospirillaceae bacterium B3]